MVVGNRPLLCVFCKARTADLVNHRPASITAVRGVYRPWPETSAVFSVSAVLRSCASKRRVTVARPMSYWSRSAIANPSFPPGRTTAPTGLPANRRGEPATNPRGRHPCAGGTSLRKRPCPQYTSGMGFLVCLIVPLVAFLVGMLIWRFMRSAVRSGVQQARPAEPVAQAPRFVPPAPPVVPGVTEADVRRIVREELRAAQQAAAARRAGSPGATPPGSSRGPSR